MTDTIITTNKPAPLARASGPGRSPDWIWSTYVSRKNKAMPILEAGDRIRRVYNGDWETALPELERRERTQVANIVRQGIEQEALRIASTEPSIFFAPERNSRPAEQRAMDRRQVIKGWHEWNRLDLKRRRRARHLIAFATSPVYIRPGPDKVPIWDVWEPLSTFSSPTGPDDLVPHDVIYCIKRSWQWLQDTFALGQRLPKTKHMTADTMVDCLIYCDAEEMKMIAVGKDGDGGNMPPILLQRVPNITGRPCVVVPGLITLDRLQGMFDQMVGMYEAQGLLWAMHLQALKRSIFAETWLQGNQPGVEPTIVNPANAMTGELGIVTDGTIQTYRADPSVQTGQTLDRQERNMRQTSGVPAELGGESGSNIRTARRGTQVLSSAIDFPIQEVQDILAASLQEENLVAMEVAKSYWPIYEKTLYVKFGDGQITYTPSELFTTTDHTVQYQFSGVSADGLVIEGLQRTGAGTLSDEGFMEIDPLITDPKFEKSRIVAEQIEKALLSSIQQQAADPAGPYQPADIAWLLTQIRTKKMDLATAVEKLNERLQAQQAQAQQGALGPEQMQPGLAMPGAPGTAAAGTPMAPGPEEGTAGLASLMGSLRNVQRGAPAVSEQVPG